MTDFEPLLNRWQSAGVLDPDAAARIRAYESAQATPASVSGHRLGWQGLVALILGAILLACGVVLFVSAHWDQLGPAARLALVLAMVAVFHLGGAWARQGFHQLSTALHAVGTISTGAAIALVGQIFNIQEHWPAAVLMWALAALAGWALLRDEAQQILALLLVPAWIACEFSFAAQGHIGADVYIGRFLLAWAVLYLTIFLASKHKIAQGVLFAAAAIAATVGTGLLTEGWQSWGSQTFLPLGTRTWGWVAFAALPLLFAAFKFRKSAVPVTVAICFSIALPWCQRTWTASSYEPNLAAYGLIAAFSVFIVWWGFRHLFHALTGLGVVWFVMGSCFFSFSHIFGDFSRVLISQILEASTALFVIWWGMRLASKILVNLGVVGFALVALWFYSADIFDKLNRSLGLIGLGVLFLAGGWALEKTRRRLVATMLPAEPSLKEAK